MTGYLFNIDMELENGIRRLEKRLAAFEKLHKEELKEFERKFNAYKELHEDEVRQLREELAQIREAYNNRPSVDDHPITER